MLLLHYWTTCEIQRSCATSLFYQCEASIWVMIMGAGVRKHESTKKPCFLAQPLIKHNKMPPGRLTASKPFKFVFKWSLTLSNLHVFANQVATITEKCCLLFAYF